ncbi:MAG: hypothetical protein RJB38_1390 [Pseudomonadota bacterium]|jgi:hypothetical protein
MAQSQKWAQSEFQLLQREIEVQGEWLNHERLERQADIDRLRMELEAIRQALSQLTPEFALQFQREFERARQEYNPEG